MTALRPGRMGGFPALLLGALLVGFCRDLPADDAVKSTNGVAASIPSQAMAAGLPPEKWKQLEASVDRALAWLATRQEPDGSFPTYRSAQPGVTSLCVLAFLSRGHQPGPGPYGRQLNRAIDFVVSCQKPDGLLCDQVPEVEWVRKETSHAAAYDHAIAGLMLGEVYGHVTGRRARAVKKAIQNALQFSRALQTRHKDSPFDKGGWRYTSLKPGGEWDSDLSATGWQLMFLRSAKNAEFPVPQNYVDEAVEFVKRCWNPQTGTFAYARASGGEFMFGGRAMAGAGILSLSMAGQHQTPQARSAGEWLLAHPYHIAGESEGGWDRYFYSTYYCSQAAMQLGGRYWEGIFPPLAETLLSAQMPDGSWPPEMENGDAIFGNLYTTAIAILALTPPYQLLPVYQK